MASRARARTVRDDRNDIPRPGIDTGIARRLEFAELQFALERRKHADITLCKPTAGCFRSTSSMPGTRISAAASMTPATPGCLCSATRISTRRCKCGFN